MDESIFDYNFFYESNDSFWNDTDPSHDKCEHHNKSDLAFVCFMIFIIIIGLIGNILVFLTIVILREYKNSVTNWYILQLTIADSLFLAMLPFTAYSEMTGFWDFSLELCKFKEAVIFINYYASIYFLVVMSFDRYLAVTKALDSSFWLARLRTPFASYVITGFGWIASILLCIPLFTYSTISDCKSCAYNFPLDESNEPDPTSSFDFDGDFFNLNYDELINFYVNYFQTEISSIENQQQECKLPNSHTLRVWIYGNFIGAFCLPFIFICIFYGMIMKTISTNANGNKGKQRSYKRRVTMIVLALVSLFAISWLPWYVNKLVRVDGVSLSPTNCNRLQNAVRGLAYLNSALNPYFYSFLGTHFFDRLKRVSSRVFLSSMSRSKIPTAESTGRRRRASSIVSVGSNKELKKHRWLYSHASKPSGKHVRDMRRISLSTKTERTIV